jgi:hypothetical protein
MSNKNESYETILARVFNFQKLRKPITICAIIGMIICIIPLLPPVQSAVFSFVGVGIEDTSENRDVGNGELENRLSSLLALAFVGFVVLLYVLCCLFSKNISVFLEDAKNKKITVVSVTSLTLLLLVFISTFAYGHGWQWLNSDHSSEMVLGQLLAEESAFASVNWGYSTEIRLVYQTLFTMPLFKLLGNLENWALIRAINIFLNNIVLLLSYYFMAKQLRMQTKWMLITGLFLVIPASGVYWDIVTFGGYYIFFIAQLFFCIGLFLKLSNNAELPKRLPVVFVLFTLLSFVLGVQGIRSLLVVHIPLLVTGIYLYLQSLQKKKFLLFLGCYGFVLGCVGFLFNFLLQFWYSFQSFDGMKFENLYSYIFQKLGSCLVSLAIFFGFSAGSSFLSAKGIFNIASILGTIILFKLVLKLPNKALAKNTAMQGLLADSFLPVFFIATVAFNIFVFITAEGPVTDRYFLPFMILYVPIVAVLFEYSEKVFAHFKRTGIVLGIILFVFGQGYLNLKALSADNVNSDRKGYIQFLLDNQLDYGFSTFWNANITTELTHGKVAIAGLEPDGLEPDGNPFKVQFFLNPLKYHNPDFHREQQGESFLLLTRQEWELAKSSNRPFSLMEPDYEDTDFIVLRFPSSYIIFSEILDN